MISAMFTVAWLAAAPGADGDHGGRHLEVSHPQAAAVAAAGVSLLGVANRELVIPARPRPADPRHQGSRRRRRPRLEPRFDALRHPHRRRQGRARRAADHQSRVRPAAARAVALRQAARGGRAPITSTPPPTIRRASCSRASRRPTHIDRLPSLSIDDRPVIVTPRDAPWLGATRCSSPATAVSAAGQRVELAAATRRWAS